MADTRAQTPFKKIGSPPIEILKRYEKWKDIVRVSGPSGLLAIRGFNDEALKGQWRGHRYSRLGQKYRVFYKIEAQNVVVMVVDLTPHYYRKK